MIILYILLHDENSKKYEINLVFDINLYDLLLYL